MSRFLLVKSRLGFTLIEVLTVMSIFGILVSLTAYIYTSSLQRSQDSQRASDLQGIKSALEQYYLDNRVYPVFEKTNNAWVFNARWQLTEGQAGDLYCPHTTAGKRYLAPIYLTQVPEDPRHKLSFVDTSDCLSAESQAGQYLYVSLPLLPDSIQDPANGYYLMAKMERSNNQNQAVSPFANGTHYRTGIDSIGLGFPTTHNYLIQSSIND